MLIVRDRDATHGPVWLLLAAACLGLFWPGHEARASWPKPAGGPSASGDPEVLFTFDDGPHEKHTATILDELGRRNLKAIFFWVGWRLTKGKQADARVALVQRAVREGHLVANHTISHPNLCQIKAEQAASEIDDNIRVLAEASGLPIRLFRAPYGAHCKRLERMLVERALGHMHWDIDPQEWEHHDVQRTVSYVTRRLAELDGRAIVILHDTHLVTAKAFPKILDWIQAENERRQTRGTKRPIRIISGSDLVAEQLRATALRWLADTALVSATRAESTLARLVP